MAWDIGAFEEYPLINKYESTTVTDVPSTKIPTLKINVNDSTTVTESVSFPYAATEIAQSRFSAISDSSTSQITVNAAPQGSRIVVIAYSNYSTQAISSVSDSRGNSYSIDVTFTDASTSCEIYIVSALATTALQDNDTVTITWSNPTYSYRFASVFYLENADVFDISKSNTTYSSTLSASETVANDSVQIGFTFIQSETYSWTGLNSEWEIIGLHNSLPGGSRGCFFEKETVSGASINPGGSFDGSVSYCVAWASYKQASTLTVNKYESVTVTEDKTVNVQSVSTALEINKYESVTVSEDKRLYSGPISKIADITGTAYSSTSISSDAFSVSVGQFIVIGITTNNNGYVSAVSDSAGNTYSLRDYIPITNYSSLRIAYATVTQASGSNVITATITDNTGSSRNEIYGYVFSTSEGSFAFDTEGSAYNVWDSAGTKQTSNFTTTGNDELVFSCCTAPNASGYSNYYIGDAAPTTYFTSATNYTGIAYSIFASTQSNIHSQFDIASSSTWLIHAVAFKIFLKISKSESVSVTESKTVVKPSRLLHTVKPTGGDFTTLSAAIEHLKSVHSNLVADNVYADIEIDGDWSGGADTTQVALNSSLSTDSSRYVHIYTTPNARHTGEWDTSKYILSCTNQTAISLGRDNIRVTGLQIEVTENRGEFYTSSCIAESWDWISNAKFDRNIFKINCNGNNGAYGIYLNNPYISGTDIRIQNCIFIGGTGTWVNHGIYIYGGNDVASLYIYNSTFKDLLCGVSHEGNTNTTVYVKNCGFINCTDDLNGTISTTTNSTSTPTLASGKSFHLASSDTTWKDQGTDLSSDSGRINSLDIDGQTRFGTWDIGADEWSPYISVNDSISITESKTVNVQSVSAPLTINVNDSVSTLDGLFQTKLIASAKANGYPTGTDGLSITHGFTLQNGDVLYAFFTQNDDTGTSVSCSDWTALTFTATATQDDILTSTLRKVITNAAGEPSSYTFVVNDNTGLDHMCVILVQLRGVDTTTPEDSTSQVSTGVDDFTPDNVNITTSTSGAMVLIAHATNLPNDTSATKTAGAPSGYTLIDSTYDSAGTGLESWLSVAYATPASTGSQNIGSWTNSPDDSTSEYHTIAVAVKPSPTIKIAQLKPIVNDSTSVTESITSTGTLNISKSESVTVTEDKTINIPAVGSYNVNKYESVSVTEERIVNRNNAATYSINKFETSSVTEYRNFTGTERINKFETVSLTEDIARKVTNYISKFDATSLTEYRNFTGTTRVSVYDAASAQEYKIVSAGGVVSRYVSVYDATTLTEFRNILFRRLLISSYDSATAQETIGKLVPFLKPIIADPTVLTEYVIAWLRQNKISVVDLISILENVQARLSASRTSVYDATTISEAVVAAIKQLKPSIFDSSNITEYRLVQIISAGIRSVSVYDSATTTEAATTLIRQLKGAVSDPVAVLDAVVSIVLNLKTSKYDSVSIIDLPSVVMASLGSLFKIDNVTLTESVNVLLRKLLTSKYDAATVTEQTIVSILSAGTRNINKFDTVTITEAVSTLIKQLKPTVYDAKTVTEYVNLVIRQLRPMATENVTMLDAASILIKNFKVINYDSVTLTENVIANRLAAAIRQVSTYDATIITEFVRLFSPTIAAVVFDTVDIIEVIGGGLYPTGFARKVRVAFRGRTSDIGFTGRRAKVTFVGRVSDTTYEG